MKKFTRSLEKHKGLIFATVTKQGVGTIHLRHKLPLYRLKRIIASLQLSLYSDVGHHNHLQFRSGDGVLVGTLVNQNLLLLPKYAKTKARSLEFAQALIDAMP